MSVPDRVYLVTSGEYSDYGVESVWTTREAAEASLHGRDEYDHARVEEYLLNTTQERSIIEWRAWIDPRNGGIRVAERATETNAPGSTEVRRRTARSYTRPWGSREKQSEWEGNGYGPTPERARKSLSDALAKAKAERQEGGDTPWETTQM